MHYLENTENNHVHRACAFHSSTRIAGSKINQKYVDYFILYYSYMYIVFDCLLGTNRHLRVQNKNANDKSRRNLNHMLRTCKHHVRQQLETVRTIFNHKFLTFHSLIIYGLRMVGSNLGKFFGKSADSIKISFSMDLDQHTKGTFHCKYIYMCV